MPVLTKKSSGVQKFIGQHENKTRDGILRLVDFVQHHDFGKIAPVRAC